MTNTEFYEYLIMCFVGILVLWWSGYQNHKDHEGRGYVLFIFGMALFLVSANCMLAVRVEKLNSIAAFALEMMGFFTCVLISDKARRFHDSKKPLIKSKSKL